jgi:hypothetical protein
MTTSNWDQAQIRSAYHFDPQRIDPRWDTVQGLGHITPTWQNDIDSIIDKSGATTWATRGYKGKDAAPPSQDLLSEEYDLTRAGMPADYTISHIGWDLPASLNPIVEAFALADCMARLHVQKPGELWNLHIDKLDKWNPDDPNSILRVFVQLTDWRPGQFWAYGNYNYSQWRAGDVTTFDWRNVPHCTANAGYHPRVTLQLTGVKTAGTKVFLEKLQNSTALKIE